MSQAPAYAELGVVIVIPVVDVPVQLRVEPRLLRVRDSDTGECRLTIDNSRSNRRVSVQLSGSDPELAVQFRFDPPVLTVGPGVTGSAVMHVQAPSPEAGLEVSRALTVTAREGDRSAETLVTMQQSTRAEDPLPTLEVIPSLVRVRNTTSGVAQVVADNRAGTEWAHLKMQASDPERLVQVIWASPVLHVPPGGPRRPRSTSRLRCPSPGTRSAAP